MRTKGLFITGTDTGVGKTYVAAGLVRELVRRGVDVGVMKPAETGCPARQGRLIPRDARSLMNAAGARDPLSLVNPYRFRKPLAPSVAAALEGKSIDPGRILECCRSLSKKHELMIVEGAGGIMVPLRQDCFFLDLAGALRLPVLIVARPGLGTINHTLLTVDALRRRRIAIAGVVFNHAHPGKAGLAERTNAALIEALSGVELLGTVGYGAADFGALAERM